MNLFGGNELIALSFKYSLKQQKRQGTEKTQTLSSQPYASRDFSAHSQTSRKTAKLRYCLQID